jgi:hypothetical protein
MLPESARIAQDGNRSKMENETLQNVEKDLTFWPKKVFDMALHKG